MRESYTVLATTYINQPELGRRPACTLLIGAAVLQVTERFGSWAFNLDAHSSLATDNRGDTLLWLTSHLRGGAARLMLWRAEDIAVPSLVAAAETTTDLVIAAQFLREFERCFGNDIIDVADVFGGARATSLVTVFNEAGLAYKPMTAAALDEAWRTSNHGKVRDHLRLRALGVWQLWARRQPNAGNLEQATLAWLEERNSLKPEPRPLGPEGLKL